MNHPHRQFEHFLCESVFLLWDLNCGVICVISEMRRLLSAASCCTYMLLRDCVGTMSECLLSCTNVKKSSSKIPNGQ